MTYLYSHLIICFFFSLHFFIVRLAKGRIDFKNRVLKNWNVIEQRRAIMTVTKAIFNYDKQAECRYRIYLKYILK